MSDMGKIKTGLCRVLTTVLLLVALPAAAHDARPAVIAITEQLPGIFQFMVRVPETVEVGNMPQVVWPGHCEAPVIQPGLGTATGSVRCDGGLYGHALSLDYPYYNPSLASFYRLTLMDGSTLTAMLAPTKDQWDIPEEPTPGNVAAQYLQLGIEHIIGGADHLLFVLGLLVIAKTLRRILWTITGFTIAHSITLSLSALGLVNIPIVPVEATIALSIVFLAHEISRDHRHSLTYRFPLIVSFSFGLLHGLGFASALGEIGLVEREILISLLFFNLGVEVGQIAFILVVSALIWVIYRLQQQSRVLTEAMTLRRVETAAAYLIGIPSSYWLIDRVAQFLI